MTDKQRNEKISQAYQSINLVRTHLWRGGLINSAENAMVCLALEDLKKVSESLIGKWPKKARFKNNEWPERLDDQWDSLL